MKHHRYLSIPIVVLAMMILFVSCQESSDIVVVEQEIIQEEFDAAIQEVEIYLDEVKQNAPEESRTNGKYDYSITLLRYDNNTEKLLYNTWDDDQKEYVEVTEEEITATVEPGCYVFTFSGKGLKALNAIEYDEPSRSILGSNSNYAIIPNRLWLTVIPENTPTSVELKYDIIYDARNDGEGPIRLDPKVKVNRGI